MIIHESDIEADFVTIVLANGYALCVVYPDENKDGKIAWLANVKVHPLFRRQGWGNRLIKQSLKLARERGFEKLQLAAAPGWRVDWYKRCGFIVIKENYCGRVIMEKVL